MSHVLFPKSLKRVNKHSKTLLVER
uniref:Uncharacterized protein n=1 Tax=Arundo donax TaxID=35708 RepID=A0A0A9BSB0_ARUDO